MRPATPTFTPATSSAHRALRAAPRAGLYHAVMWLAEQQRWWIVVPFVAALVAIHGCGPRQAYRLEPDAPMPSDLASLVVLPVNFDHTTIAQVQSQVGVVERSFVNHVQDAGFETQQPKLSRVLELWSGCIRAVGGIVDTEHNELDPQRFVAAREELARRILSELQADAVVMPTVVVREGRMSGFRFRWDGVIRDVPVDLSETVHVRAGLSVRGQDHGTSLRVMLFDRSGRLFFERYAGLEPLHRYKIADGKWFAQIRTDLFRDDEILKDGFARALSPWIADPPQD